MKMIGSSTCRSGGRATLSGGNQRISPLLGARAMSTDGGTHLTDEGAARSWQGQNQERQEENGVHRRHYGSEE
jgi:hypothetical protein